jgi:hypothetical protein
VTTPDVPGTGSILRIQRAGRYLYLDTHLTPSAGNLLVLNEDLKLQRELYGYSRVFLPNGNVVFRNSQVHFMPTHWAELSLYDPAADKEKQIYPPVPADSVRSEFVARVRKAYAARGEDWFRINNHYMDPEKFDSSDGPIRVDEKSNAIAFLVRYENPINDSGDPEAAGQTVVVTCTSVHQVDNAVCRERSLAVWADALKLSKETILAEPYGRTPVTDELLRRAAANPAAVR